MMEGLFRDWKGKKTDLKRIYIKPSKQMVNIDKDIEQVHIVFGFPGPGLIDKDRYAAEVLDAALSRGIPVAGVLGGGYDTDLEQLAARHIWLHRAAALAHARWR
jgi:predicted Zn-dependent peptidase